MNNNVRHLLNRVGSIQRWTGNVSYDSEAEGWRLAQELFDDAAFKLDHTLAAMHIEVPISAL